MNWIKKNNRIPNNMCEDHMSVDNFGLINGSGVCNICGKQYYIGFEDWLYLVETNNVQIVKPNYVHVTEESFTNSWYRSMELEYEKKNAAAILKNYEDSRPKLEDGIEFPVPIIFGTSGEVPKGSFDELWNEDEDVGGMGLVAAVASYRQNHRDTKLIGSYPGPTNL